MGSQFKMEDPEATFTNLCMIEKMCDRRPS